MSHVSPAPCSQDQVATVATGTGLKRRDRCHPNVHRWRHRLGVARAARRPGWHRLTRETHRQKERQNRRIDR